MGFNDCEVTETWWYLLMLNFYALVCLKLMSSILTLFGIHLLWFDKKVRKRRSELKSWRVTYKFLGGFLDWPTWPSCTRRTSADCSLRSPDTVHPTYFSSYVCGFSEVLAPTPHSTYSFCAWSSPFWVSTHAFPYLNLRWSVSFTSLLFCFCSFRKSCTWSSYYLGQRSRQLSHCKVASWIQSGEVRHRL